MSNVPPESGDRPITGTAAVTMAIADPTAPNRTLSVEEVMQTLGKEKDNKRLVKILEGIDKNNDGTIDVAELVQLLGGVNRARRERKYLIITVIAMFIFGLVLIGTIVGLTYAVVYAIKDTEVKGGVMYAKNSEGVARDIIRTGSAEFGVENGAMVHRLTTDAAGNATGTGSVLQTAAYMGVPQALNSEIDIGTLLELKYLLINGTGQAQLGLLVQGVARVPQAGSVYGTVLHVITAAGTITLDGHVITFSTAIANIFADAGFRVSTTRRALLGVYNVLGFFNTVKDLSASGKPPSEPEPKLASENFVMKIKVYEPCVVPDQPDVDRCVYDPPKPAGSAGLPPPPPDLPSAAWPPVAPAEADASGDGPADANPTESPNPTESDKPASPARRLALQSVPSSAGPAEGAARRRLRHRHVATAPRYISDGRGRHLEESEGSLDLAGVELYRGARYMTHHETTYAYGGAFRVMYDFALYPRFQKVDITSTTSPEVYTWQQTVLPEGSTNEVETYFCRNFSSPATGAAGFNASSVLSYTYAGIDSVGDVLARRFELLVAQPSSKNPAATAVMRIDYWDTLDTFTPLRFEFEHSDIGAVVVEVLEFRPIDASSPEAAPAMYVAPPQETCPVDTSLPRLSSPFVVRGSVVSDEPPAAADPITRRRLIAESAALAHEWEQLDHVNGTGDWPQWALDMYGGVHPARRSLQAATRRALADCGTKTSAGVPLGFCSIDYWAYLNGGYGLAASCGGNVGVVALSGSLEMDSCEGKVQGCLSVGVGLASDNWLVKKIGISLEIQIASACIGYNVRDKYFYVQAALTLDLIIFKAEVSIEVDFSSCCIWISSVTLEASVGFTFANIWVTVGSIDVVSSLYLKGSSDEQQATVNPSASNLVGWTTVGEGFWGDWGKATFPCTRMTNDVTGGLKMVALPMNSYQLRVEAQSSGDDTALNGIAVQCLDGSKAAKVDNGDGWWGDWSSFASCPAGGFFVGAKMRIEAPGGDDTAANSVVFTCNNNNRGDVNAHSGWWGDWTAYQYCSGSTYICGLQVRQEPPGGDDTALNGLRIACCGFPTDNAMTVMSTTSIMTATSSPSSCFDVTDNKQASGTFLQQWLCTANTTRQLFTVKSTVEGAYTIAAVPSGLCVTVQSGGTAAGTRIILANCVGALSQLFSIVPYGQGWYTISPMHTSGRILEVANGNWVNGAVLQIANVGSVTTQGQVFALNVPTRSTRGPICVSNETFRAWCVDLVLGYNVKPYEGAKLDLKEGSYMFYQQFTVTTAGTNAYQIRSEGGLCLTSAGAWKPMTISKCFAGYTAQLFKATPGKLGGVSLSPYDNLGQCINVWGAYSKVSSVQLDQCNGGQLQSFILTLPV